MRIGETLARILSPGAADEDASEARAADDAGASEFRAAFEAAIERRREPAGAGGLDPAAAIVIDPRFVLSLGAPARLAEWTGGFDTGRESIRDAGRTFDAAAENGAPHDAAREAARAIDAESAGAHAARESDDANAQFDANDPAPEGTSSARSGANAEEHGTSSPAPRESSARGSSTPNGGDSGTGAPRASTSAITIESVARQIAATAGGEESANAAGAAAEAARGGAGADGDPASGESKGAPQTAGAAPAPDGSSRAGAAATDGFDQHANHDDSGGASQAPGGLQGSAPAAPAGDGVTFAATLAHELASASGAARTQTVAGSDGSIPGAASHAARVEKNEILARLSEGVAGALRAGRREIVVRLSPPNLGAVRIRFHVDDQRVAARVEVADPAVHRALESNVAELRTVLRQHAVELADLSLANGDGRARGGPEGDAHDAASRERDARTDTSPAASTLTPRRRAAYRASGLDIMA